MKFIYKEYQMEKNGLVMRRQHQKLKDYTSWMYGKSFKSAEEFKGQIGPKIKEINDAVAKDKGFSSYNIKELLLL